MIVGASGFLATYIAELFSEKYKVFGADIVESVNTALRDFYKLDFTDNNEVELFFKENKFDIIINCAAIVNSDYCEENYEQARNVNAFIPRNTLNYHKNYFIQISTDILFNGFKKKYNENDLPCPLNNYGKTKLEAEWFVNYLSKKFLILRTNFFGKRILPGKHTSVEWMYYTLEEKKELKLFYDYYFTPIYIISCCCSFIP